MIRNNLNEIKVWKKKLKTHFIYSQLENKLLTKVNFCVKEESKFLKGINGEVISNKVPYKHCMLFHAKTTRIRRFQSVIFNH